MVGSILHSFTFGMCHAVCKSNDNDNEKIFYLTVDITITIFIIVLEKKITNWSGDYH